MYLLISGLLGLHCRVGFSLVVKSGSYSPVAVCRLLITVASPGAEHRLRGSQASGSCGPGAQELQFLGSSTQNQQLRHTGLAAPQHVGSSQIMDQNYVFCIGRQILYHRATREAQNHQNFNDIPSFLLFIR